jgi:hypothetical protein
MLLSANYKVTVKRKDFSYKNKFSADYIVGHSCFQCSVQLFSGGWFYQAVKTRYICLDGRDGNGIIQA